MHSRFQRLLSKLCVFFITILASSLIAYFASSYLIAQSGLDKCMEYYSDLQYKIRNFEQVLSKTSVAPTEVTSDFSLFPNLKGKKIIYDGDSIAASYRELNGGGYPALISSLTDSTYQNFAKGGGRLCSSATAHSVVDNLTKLPTDGDLYCFEGGINDFWSNAPIGEITENDYSGEYDTNTLCGALETIFRYSIDHFPGKPVCFVITHKIQKTATSENENGDTFQDYRNAMIAVCHKYSIPYYDAFNESGLNGWNHTQNQLFLTANSENTPDGIHPTSEGYSRYYVPQLIDLFENIIPY